MKSTLYRQTTPHPAREEYLLTELRRAEENIKRLRAEKEELRVKLLRWTAKHTPKSKRARRHEAIVGEVDSSFLPIGRTHGEWEK